MGPRDAIWTGKHDILTMHSCLSKFGDFSYFRLFIGIFTGFDLLIQVGQTYVLHILMVWASYIGPKEAIWTGQYNIYASENCFKKYPNSLYLSPYGRSSDPPYGGVRGGQFHNFYFLACFCDQMHNLSLLPKLYLKICHLTPSPNYSINVKY